MNRVTARKLAEVLSASRTPGSDGPTVCLESAEVGAWRAAVITLSRPERHNVLGLDDWRAISGALDALRDQPEIRLVIIRGAGGSAFSAGADITEFPEKRFGEAAAHYNTAIAAALKSVQDMPAPVIAMIDGLAIGGGFELASACDVRLGSTRARFGVPIGRLGVILGLSETRAVSAAIGAASLKYLVYSGQLISADRAFACGYLQELSEPDQLVDATVALAETIAAASEVTVRATKVIAALAALPEASATDPMVAALEAQAYGGVDLPEGVDAFLSRRPPEFTSVRSIPNGRS